MEKVVLSDHLIRWRGEKWPEHPAGDSCCLQSSHKALPTNYPRREALIPCTLLGGRQQLLTVDNSTHLTLNVLGNGAQSGPASPAQICANCPPPQLREVHLYSDVQSGGKLGHLSLSWPRVCSPCTTPSENTLYLILLPTPSQPSPRRCCQSFALGQILSFNSCEVEFTCHKHTDHGCTV